MKWYSWFIHFLPHKLIALLAIAALMVGLVTTRVVLSVATITLACNALLHPDAASHFKRWWSHRSSKWFLWLFFAYLFSGFYSQNLHTWWVNTQDKLPLLAIPFGYTLMRKDLKEYSRAMLYVFVLIMTLTALLVMGNFLLHFAEFSLRIKSGQAIPTPMNDHIRFSLSLAFAALTALYLRTDPQRNLSRWWQYALPACAVVLATTLHFLAVRSGLLALYAGIAIFIWHYGVRQRHWKTGLIAGVLALICLVSLVRLIPSLHNKYLYFIYEWQLMSKGEFKEGHSDAQRVQSIALGWQVASDYFPFGTGSGDLRTTMTEQYASHPATRTIKPELPHNQFVYTLAAAGLPALMILMIAFFYPLGFKKYRQQWLIPAFMFIIFISFMTEHILEIQIGISFVMLFSVLLPAVTDAAENAST